MNFAIHFLRQRVLTEIASRVAQYLNTLPESDIERCATSGEDLAPMLERELLRSVSTEDAERYLALARPYMCYFTDSDCGILLERIQSRLTPSRALILSRHADRCRELLLGLWRRLQEAASGARAG